VTWHCYYRTVEECVPNVLAGNRGSCNLNPYFTASRGPATAARPAHRKRG
jgi:phage tail protein X